MYIFDNKIKICFIYSDRLKNFKRNDLEILQNNFNVKPVQWKGKLSIINIALNILKTDLSFSWFASDEVAIVIFLSKLFRKKSIIITGGSDVVNLPEINYGISEKKFISKKLTIFALKNANKLLAFSNSSMVSVEKILGFHPNGLETVFLGLNTNIYHPNGKKENIALTVGDVSKNNLKRKGIDFFVKSARFLPDVKFIVAGKIIDDSIDYLKSIATPNVHFTGFITNQNLLKLYRRAKVYAQLSKHEGFGLAMAEAMSCGCIPVVTPCGAIPEVVGKAGFYVPYGKPKEAAKAIHKALQKRSKIKARERIIELFTLEKREKKLIDVINSLFQNK